MLLNSLMGGDLREFFITLLLSLPIVFISLSVHETAHGFVAYKLGDPTAHNYGRITLNPIQHIDPIGFICMLFFGFGWARPVPVNSRYFKKPRRDMALTGVAGPISNLILAVVFALLARLEYALCSPMALINPATTVDYIWFFLWQMLWLGIEINVVFAVFNMIPIPPLDGSRLLFALLPPAQYFKFMRYERYISIALMLALFLGFLDTPINLVSNLFLRLITTLIF